MTDPGLNTRLRQRSRRAGIMIGISMALTIAVCVAGFSVIYAALDGFTGDFVSRDASTVVPTNAPQTTEVAQVASGAQGQPTAHAAAAAPTTVPTEAPVATASPSAFTPNYQITSTSTVNLRSGPGVKGNATITALSPQTPLQFLNDRQKTTDPSGDGFSGDWLKFRTESGDDGWVREIDVGTYVP
jgi:hypothetical protein